MDVWLWLAMACTGLSVGPTVPPADPVSLSSALVVELGDGPLNLRYQPLHTDVRYGVQLVRFSLRPGFDVSAALWTPSQPNGVGVLVAHGHFDQGKSSPEAQEIAHRLADRGYTVLAVDTPGVEEWDVPGRRIHFRDGAHNRAFLAASGSSALALQLAVLRRGLDVLQQHGSQRLLATGASGGAALSFYLQLTDQRVVGAALASFPRMPRSARAGGCECDQIPGWVGPDATVLAALPQPSLWMSDVPQERPTGLPDSARFVVEAGPHSYTRAMQDRAIRWFDDLVGHDGGEILDSVPLLQMDGWKPSPGGMSIFDLPVQTDQRWTPTPTPSVPVELSCAGSGAAVVVGGGDAADVAALQSAGFRACSVALLTGDEAGWSSLDLEESIARRDPLANRYAGAIAQAVKQTRAVGAWGVRAWGLAAAGAGVPFVVRDPVLQLDGVVPAVDPPWIHVPGAWSGGASGVVAGAVGLGTDRAQLVAALEQAVQ